EQRVREMRRCLREAEALRAAGDGRGAARLEARARELEDSLLRHLVPRFRRWAGRKLANPELGEDAVVGMGLTLCRRLRNTAGSYLYLEQRFNAAIKTLMIDAIRKIRQENGLDRTGQPATEGYRVESLEGSAAEDEEGVSLADRIAEPEALQALEDRLGA